MNEKIKISIISFPIFVIVIGGTFFTSEIYFENEKENPDIRQSQHSTDEHRYLIVSGKESSMSISSPTPVAIEALLIKELFIVKEINQNGISYYL